MRSLEGRQDYLETLGAMQALTRARTAATRDELWLLEHPPVFTLGQASRPEHLLAPGPIPVVQSDRGGQVTYHGPGQLIAYLLLDLRRTSLGVKRLVALLEQTVLNLLARHDLRGEHRPDAPGVYVEGAKIASLGLRIRNGCSYHGLALNVAMDLTPFGRINPCGHPGLAVTQLRDQGIDLTVEEAGAELVEALAPLLGRQPVWRPATTSASTWSP